jgi:hypothetical protein
VTITTYIWEVLGTLDILSEILGGFSQFLETNAGIISRLGQDRMLPNPFRFIIDE